MFKNYDVSFGLKIGKKYINGRYFEKIANNYWIKSKLTDMARKDREIRAKTAEAVKELNEIVEKRKCNEELYKKLYKRGITSVDEIEHMLRFDKQLINDISLYDDASLSTAYLRGYNDSFNNYLKNGDYANAYALNENVFKNNKNLIKRINKETDTIKSKIKNNEKLSLKEALMLSQNKTCISIDHNSKKFDIKKYLAAHPVNDEIKNIAQKEFKSIAKSYEDPDYDGELSKIFVWNDSEDKKIIAPNLKKSSILEEGHVMDVDGNGRIRSNINHPSVNALALNIKAIYKNNDYRDMTFSEMYSSAIGTATGSNIEEIFNNNYIYPV